MRVKWNLLSKYLIQVAGTIFVIGATVGIALEIFYGKPSERALAIFVILFLLGFSVVVRIPEIREFFSKLRRYGQKKFRTS